MVEFEGRIRHHCLIVPEVSMMLRNTLVVLLAVIATMTTAATAQPGYPNRPIRVVIQFAPGGSDVVARILCQKMGESLGQPFVIDNRPGAAGVIGANIVAKAAPDGYTTLFATASFAVTAAFNKQLPYDSIRDFDSIGFIGSQPFMLVVHPSLQVNSVRDFIALSKSRPLNYASAGGGGIGHLTQELFNHLTGIRATHVPYKGTGPMVTALIAGEVPAAMVNISGGWAHVRGGRLRALGVATLKRTTFAPDLPTIAESGLPGFESGTWYGLTAPRGTAAATIALLNREIAAALKTDTREKLAVLGVDVAPSTPREFTDFFRAEVAKWSKIIKVAGISDQ
jgi:tripartite-type tricarboxylate transporter receptor subunit TctC